MGVISGCQKFHFYFRVMPRNAQNRSLKNDVINRYGLGLYVYQKYIYQTEIWHARFACMAIQHIIRFSENFENFGFWNKLYKNLVFKFLGDFFLIRDSHLKKNFLFYACWCFLIAFCLKLLVLVIFQTFVISGTNGMPLGHTSV